jgi:twitching motility two-component system response regulator PilH
MRSITCTLTFSDGKHLIGKAASRTEDARVVYQSSGDLSRIKALPEKGTLGFLEWYLRGCALNAGGEFNAEVEGDFEISVPKVLIVDDDPLMRLLYKNHLEKAGYELVTAPSAEEGLAIARQQKPVVVVLDVILGGVDGLAALRALKGNEETSGIPVILFSASMSEAHYATRKEASRAGAAAFFTKPISPDQLLKEIKRLAPIASK